MKNIYNNIDNGVTELVIISPKYGTIKCIIDTEDFDKVSAFRWSLLKRMRIKDVKFYVTSKIKNKTFYIHRIITKSLWETVDHINRDTLDNRKTNLREATKKQQAINRVFKTKYASGVKRNSKNRFEARIGFNGKKLYLGNFKTIEEAHKAYVEASKKYHGEFSPYFNS
jgi:hypothetical protein